MRSKEVMVNKEITLTIPEDFYDWLESQAHYQEVACETDHNLNKEKGYKELSVEEYIVHRLMKCSMKEYHHNIPLYKKPETLEYGCWCDACTQWEKY